MEDLLRFFGETLFGVGIIVMLVFAGLIWYLLRLRAEIRKLDFQEGKELD